MQVVRRVGGTWHGHRLILFGFLSQSSKTKAVAVACSVAHAARRGGVTPRLGRGDLAGFRREFYACLTARADALFELADAVLCADGPVTLAGRAVAGAEHRRGHGALYDALNHGPGRARPAAPGAGVAAAARAADGRIVLAVDVSPWLRPDAATSPDRLFCHVYGRGKGSAQMIPGWPYSFVAALETGPHLLDRGAGRGPAGPGRRRHRGDRRPAPRRRRPG